jgi:hypothetical protein
MAGAKLEARLFRHVLNRLRSVPSSGLAVAEKNQGRFALLGFLLVVFSVAPRSNKQLVPAPGTTRHVSWWFRGRRGTAARWASPQLLQEVSS